MLAEIIHHETDQLHDYLLDRGVQRSQNYTGIMGTNLQNQAITESMRPIYDRSASASVPATQ